MGVEKKYRDRIKNGLPCYGVNIPKFVIFCKGTCYEAKSLREHLEKAEREVQRLRKENEILMKKEMEDDQLPIKKEEDDQLVVKKEEDGEKGTPDVKQEENDRSGIHQKG